MNSLKIKGKIDIKLIEILEKCDCIEFFRNIDGITTHQLNEMTLTDLKKKMQDIIPDKIRANKIIAMLLQDVEDSTLDTSNNSILDLELLVILDKCNCLKECYRYFIGISKAELTRMSITTLKLELKTRLKDVQQGESIAQKIKMELLKDSQENEQIHDKKVKIEVKKEVKKEIKKEADSTSSKRQNQETTRTNNISPQEPDKEGPLNQIYDTDNVTDDDEAEISKDNQHDDVMEVIIVQEGKVHVLPDIVTIEDDDETDERDIPKASKISSQTVKEEITCKKRKTTLTKEEPLNIPTIDEDSSEPIPSTSCNNCIPGPSWASTNLNSQPSNNPSDVSKPSKRFRPIPFVPSESTKIAFCSIPHASHVQLGPGSGEYEGSWNWTQWLSFFHEFGNKVGTLDCMKWTWKPFDSTCPYNILFLLQSNLLPNLEQISIFQECTENHFYHTPIAAQSFSVPPTLKIIKVNHIGKLQYGQELGVIISAARESLEKLEIFFEGETALKNFTTTLNTLDASCLNKLKILSIHPRDETQPYALYKEEIVALTSIPANNLQQLYFGFGMWDYAVPEFENMLQAFNKLHKLVIDGTFVTQEIIQPNLTIVFPRMDNLSYLNIGQDYKFAANVKTIQEREANRNIKKKKLHDKPGAAFIVQLKLPFLPKLESLRVGTMYKFDFDFNNYPNLKDFDFGQD